MKSVPLTILLLAPLWPASAEEPSAPPLPALLEILPQDVLSTRITHDGLRNVTLQKLDAAAMEDQRRALPAVVPPQPPVEQMAEEAQKQLTDAKPLRTVAFGASVHIPDPAHPERAVTHLQLWDGGLRSASFWVPANFLWLSGHGGFESETVRYSTLLMVSEGSPAEEGVPAFSSLPPGGFAVAEGEPTAEDTAAIRTMLDFYHQDTQGLRAQYEARRVQAAAAAAERAANPPERKSVILRYWRADEAGIRAAREGGAR